MNATIVKINCAEQEHVFNLELISGGITGDCGNSVRDLYW